MLAGGQVVDAWKFSVEGSARRDRATLQSGYTYTYGSRGEGFLPNAEYGATFDEVHVEELGDAEAVRQAGVPVAAGYRKW